MAQFVLAAPPRVGVGGRWHAIEEENRALASELQAWRGEAESAHGELATARREEQALQSQSAASEAVCEASNQELHDCQSEAAFLRQTLARGAEASADLQGQIFEVTGARSELAAECAALQRSLGKHEEQASQLQGLAARAELKASREESGRLEAEASRDCLRAELNIAEERLVKRGVHVDVLLQDKQRLWSQLSRARRSNCIETDSKDAPRTPKKGESAPIREHIASHSGHARPRSASSTPTKAPPKGSACSTPTKVPCRRSVNTTANSDSRPLALQDERCLELQRRVWQLEKALERERAGHEQARESLRIRGWRSDKSGSTDASTQVECGE